MSGPDPKLLGVVLCGGRSTRMGHDKAKLTTSAGTTFLDHAYQRLAAVCETVCLSASAQRTTSYRIISDPANPHGPISGIDASLQFAMLHGYDACVFCPVDTPDLTVHDLTILLDAFRGQRDKIVCAINADHFDDAKGMVEPLIAVYPVSSAPIIHASINDGQYSLQRLLRMQAIVRVPIAAVACQNINTPTDLTMNQSFQFADPDSAIEALGKRIFPVTDTEATDQSVGRVLAESVVADRDSPAADVSAMDGYAIHLSDLQAESAVPISSESKAGNAPPPMVSGKVVRIFTGAIVPTGCEAIVKREDTVESVDSIRFLQTAIDTTVGGTHIRRCGENAPAGSEVFSAGIQITPAVIAALANFGRVSPLVSRRIKVALLTTGDEVLDPSTAQVEPWQLRNSNRSAVQAMLSQLPFVSVEIVEHLLDDRGSLIESLEKAVRLCDAVVITGGVSKGDYDHVPDTIAGRGAEIVFHGLPIRPGKPILGAATDTGKLILGLPGNPVSTTINGHRFLLPLLRRLGGMKNWMDRPSVVTLAEPPTKPIGLHTMLLARMIESGVAELVPARGSGDLVALAQSDGYVCVPPMDVTTGPWPMFRW